MSIDRAIASIGAELVELGLGSPRQPAEGSADWYLLHAKAAGLSLLHRMKQLELDANPREVTRFYRRGLKAFKVDEPVEVE